MSNNETNMQIFTIIGKIEELIESSPKPKLGNAPAKRLVDVDELRDLLGDLKVTIPEDIRRANSVIIESQAMMENAQEHSLMVVSHAQQKAERAVADANNLAETLIAKAKQEFKRMVDEAKEEYERLVCEDEIYNEAQKRAELLAKKAEANATIVYESAKNYADAVLRDLESFIYEYQRLVAANRNELGAKYINPVIQPATPQAAMPPQMVMPQQSAPVQPMAEQQRASRPPAHSKINPVNRSDDDDYDDDDYEDDAEKGSFFAGLFKRRKKVEDDDFDE